MAEETGPPYPFIKRTLDTLLPYALWRWLYSPLLCKIGRHRKHRDSWGFGGSVIDWFCSRCSKLRERTPLDDATDEERAAVFELGEHTGHIGQEEK